MAEEPRTEGGTPPTGTPPTGPGEGSSSSATETPSATPATLAKALEVAEELLQAVKRANPSSTGKQHAVPSPPLSTSAAKLHGYRRSQTKAKGLVKQTRTYLQASIPKEGPPAWSMHMPWPPRRGCLPAQRPPVWTGRIPGLTVSVARIGQGCFCIIGPAHLKGGSPAWTRHIPMP